MTRLPQCMSHLLHCELAFEQTAAESFAGDSARSNEALTDLIISSTGDCRVWWLHHFRVVCAGGTRGTCCLRIPSASPQNIILSPRVLHLTHVGKMETFI